MYGYFIYLIHPSFSHLVFIKSLLVNPCTIPLVAENHRFLKRYTFNSSYGPETAQLYPTHSPMVDYRTDLPWLAVMEIHRLFNSQLYASFYEVYKGKEKSKIYNFFNPLIWIQNEPSEELGENSKHVVSILVF